MPDESPVMSGPVDIPGTSGQADKLPNFRELAYPKLDQFYQEIVYRELLRYRENGFTPAALDLFTINMLLIAQQCEVVRARIAAQS